MPHKAVEIANAFLALPAASAGLTQMQLQKLAYFAHGWNWAINGEPLIQDGFEAWTFGPVVRDLYDHTKLFGSAPIQRLITPDDSHVARFFGGNGKAPPYRADLTERENQVLEQVLSSYGGLSAGRLSEMTHQPDTPWSKAFKLGQNTPIGEDEVRAYFDALADRAAEAMADHAA
ncbi:MAG TPA: type II toxin-antitoxin system antitoxin SocA domain-containing protein [Caulobacter sp.]|nr:type II toxin-antitoxin system antitoxin SocA domain-containing protein [Caulobacter sp.]